MEDIDLSWSGRDERIWLDRDDHYCQGSIVNTEDMVPDFVTFGASGGAR